MLQQLAQKGARADWVGSVLVAPALACSAATARPWVAWAQGGGPRCGETRSVVAQVRRLAQRSHGVLYGQQAGLRRSGASKIRQTNASPLQPSRRGSDYSVICFYVSCDRFVIVRPCTCKIGRLHKGFYAIKQRLLACSSSHVVSGSTGRVKVRPSPHSPSTTSAVV